MGTYIKKAIIILFHFILFPIFSQEANLENPGNSKKLIWNFPINRTHAGILMGNGKQGLMIWGKDNILNITIARTGFWDHRSDNYSSIKTTYKEVKKLLEVKDEVGLKKLFATPISPNSQPKEPHQIGGGVLEIKLPEGWKLLRGDLLLQSGEILLFVSDKIGTVKFFTLNQSPYLELTWLKIPNELIGKITTRLIPAGENLNMRKEFEKTGVKPPKNWIKGNIIGFTQSLPDDVPLAVACQNTSKYLLITTILGEKIIDDKIIDKAEKIFTGFNADSLINKKNEWWFNYWSEVPKIILQDTVLQEIVDYGLYKQACLTPPQGLPATLQGPFMEEYQLPPWSNDYHFNINLEMIYTPALATNRLSHFSPLWKMIQNWMPQLRKNGETFFGTKDAMMLSAATDDRCQIIGTYWTGTIDHACTAWMAMLAWQHYRYGMDEKILQETAYPLLVGAFEGYWGMLEEITDNNGVKSLALPVSVSPEYGGAGILGWGKNASFQLAALHMIASILPKAAQVMGKPIDPRWISVSQQLPIYTLVDKQIFEADPWMSSYSKKPHIGLWEGKELIDSHRHHSHLAGIYPFATFNLKEINQRKIIDASINYWVHKGTGAWTGWCIPWASIIHSRVGNTSAAISLLHFWRENFVNEGRGTLHNANKNGISVPFGSLDYSQVPAIENHEVMQMDAGLGALSAVIELLVQNINDEIYILPGLNAQLKNLQFYNILTEGAFLVSGEVSNGRVKLIKIKSKMGGKLKLYHGLGEAFLLDKKEIKGSFLEKEFIAGEEVMLKSIYNK